MSDALHQPRLVHLIRNLGDDDGLTIFIESLDRGLGAHHEAASASAVGLENPRPPIDDARGGKVRPLHEFQNFRQLRVGIVHQRDGGIDDLSQIVWRDVGCHSHSNSVRSIHQQIRNARGEHVRLDFAAVIVRAEVDGFLVQILK